MIIDTKKLKTIRTVASEYIKSNGSVGCSVSWINKLADSKKLERITIDGVYFIVE